MGLSVVLRDTGGGAPGALPVSGRALGGFKEAIVLDRVTVDPAKVNGRPCIRGLRFTVAHLLRLVAAGWTFEQIQEEFPFIEAEDIQQALLYAAHSAEVTALPPRGIG